MSIFRQKAPNAMQYRLKILFKRFFTIQSAGVFRTCRNRMCQIRHSGQFKINISSDQYRREAIMLIDMWASVEGVTRAQTLQWPLLYGMQAWQCSSSKWKTRQARN